MQPPLFGHEILAILCGVIYGLWVGFAVVSAGTLLGRQAVNLFRNAFDPLTGEWGNFYAFRYLFTKKARHLEANDIKCVCLTGGVRVFMPNQRTASPA